MIRFLASAVVAAAFAFPALADDAPKPLPEFTAGLLGKPQILLPTVPVTGTVVLFADKDGWTSDESSLATDLQKSGAIVVGVDTTAMYAGLEADKDDECIYLVADIEDLSHQIQRALGTPNYHSPIIAGVGTAGTLALAIAAQTPDATFGHSVVVDPTLALPLKKPLCTDAPRQATADGSIYGLAEGDLTNPVDVLYTSAAPKDGRDHVTTLQGQGFAIKSKDVTEGAFPALKSRLTRLLSPKPDTDNPLADLPLVELPAPVQHSSMAIIFSGDGGWRDLDKSIGDAFQKEGVPTIGVDSLRYFWSRKTPQQTSADLARIIDYYTEKWGIDHVVLVGYSFGADVLPSAYRLLPPDEQSQVSEVSLLGLSDQVDYVISVGAFLGTNSGDAETLPDIKAMKPSLIQCFYGEEEDDSLCPKLEGTGVELIKTTGGHHFDGDYDGLARRILDGLNRRLSGAVEPVADR
ncbi:virulence factor family protein [Mesorhizobium sp. BR1-1-16]|uniref:virulence factor family protein n=1 Tax=Mesorhizobium sp. BR1-1-16 TaxID=2876653 RepID=UPI001CCA07C7|nr:AcvB/VirJ family lysyl-phosphatidylglycerol hydrolase [Mesorhizobium sp. BR1-1-16]MBZ9936520.1 virulence factor family protein [Mesorhizobium sp. BR1-1-16]